MTIQQSTNNSSVTNTVSVTSDAGGNTILPGGTTTHGTSSIDIFIETTVNGKTVEHLERHIESATSTEVRYEKKVERGNGMTETKIKSHAAISAEVVQANVGDTSQSLEHASAIHIPRGFIQKLQAFLSYVFTLFS